VCAQEAGRSAAVQLGQVRGLFFGIDTYPRGNALPNCRNDAQDMHDLLRRNGVPVANLRLLLDGDCTRKAMLDALAELSRTAKTGDEVVVYFSGHGSQKPDTNGDEPDGVDETWVTVELDQILDDELDEAFTKIAGTVFVISDSCHSGSVSKDVEIPDTECLGKFLSPEAIADRKGGEPIARDVAPERRRRQEERNSAGGDATPGGGVACRTRLFAACSDEEVANASRRERNSAFTAQLLAVVAEARGRALRFGELRDRITARLRNRAYRRPQNPSLFQLDAMQAVPSWLVGAPAEAVEAFAPSAVPGLADATCRQIGTIVTGLMRREDAAPNQRRDWISAFRTDSGQNEGRTGDPFGVRLEVATTVPSTVWLCVFNVGPSGNMTLLYPNAYDRCRPFHAGERLELGCGDSEVGLRLTPPAGREDLVAFALEWDPFAGIDFGAFADTDHTFLSTAAGPEAGVAARAGLLRARDVGAERRRSRPGEGWDRAVLSLQHR
jgi:hypothetical protein